MRINRAFGLLALVVVLIAAIAIGFMRIGRGSQSTASSLTLRDLLNSEDCARACWQGIEPGVTPGDEARIALEKANIHFQNVELPGDNGGIYDFSQNNRNRGMISFSDQTVNQVVLEMKVCISRIIDEYGIPAEVQENNNTFLLLYPETGLIFSINGEVSTTQIAGIFFTSKPVFEGNFSGDRLDYNWNEFKDTFAGACEDSID